MPNTARFGARKDANHDLHTQALERAGYWHADTYRTGHGFPDLITMSKTGILVLFEIKVLGAQLTDPERIFHANFPLNGPLHISYAPEQMLDILARYDNIHPGETL